MELIDRKVLLLDILENKSPQTYNAVKATILAQSTIQERTAELDGDGGDLWCTACNKFFEFSDEAFEWKFCPNCGTKFQEVANG